MTYAAAIAGAYVTQLWIKAGLALRKRVNEPVSPPADLARITIVQPVMSGDETLAENLAANVRELSAARFIWIADRNDPIAKTVCESLRAKYPRTSIRLLETEEPPAGFNPKLWKQAAAVAGVETELLAVVDDDTRLPRTSIDRLVEALDEGADLATGLPCYVPARGAWSRLVAEFVNSSAILTYLSAAQCAQPRSINGMCYLLRTDYVRERDLFAVTGCSITDDLAIAKEVRRRGGRIAQTSRPQFIRTTVVSARHYVRLMHRWFVFIRILVQNETPVVRLLLTAIYGLHPLLLAALFVLAVSRPADALVPVALVLLARSVALAGLNRVLTGEVRHSPVGSLANELLQPVFLLVAWIHPVIWWRRRRIRVRTFEAFDYLSS